jgi:N-methylhydantoinase A
MSWLIGVDVGGTFTDFYALDEDKGIEFVHKTSSTPDNPAQAILDGLDALAADKGLPLEAISRLSHGTTVGTNALIQRIGGSVAVITTEGFRDLLEIGRQIRPKMFDLKADYPAPLAPRQRRFEIAERITAGGRVLKPVTDDDIAAAIEQVRESGAESCAVCLLFAFLNPDHERRIGEALQAALPDLYVSLSSDVQPEFREYERFSTTLLNTYLQPLLNNYMSHLERELKARAPAALVGINQSSGGLMSIDRARRFPIRTALSGPAAGAIGAVYSARLSDRPNVITLDMGGTSADICLIRNHEAGLGFEREVAGFPIRLAMIDINTVGAGGGSVAWFDRDGLLKVGPTSAGAVPGPACYGQGGDRPTVTDANMVLGRLSPKGLLGGTMKVDVTAARRVLDPVAGRLEFSVERTAHGILGIVAANMVRAIRAVSVERGHDPRDFTLMPFGGAGALHAGEVARTLDIGQILVPLMPGILCAQGLVVSDLKEEFLASARTSLEAANALEMQDRVEALEAEAEDWFKAEQITADRRVVQIGLDMRYVGQNFELRVGLETPRLPDIQTLRELFFQVHEMNYGYYNPHDPIEVINYRLTARGRLGLPPAPSAVAGQTPTLAPFEARPVYFEAERPVETPIYDRSTLAPGHVIEGPAVIEQLDATTLVFPGDVATVDTAHNLLVEIST